MCALAAVAAAQTPSPASRTFALALEARLDSLDPAYYASGTENTVGNNVAETLLARDPKTGKLVPRAAQSFAVSSDGLTITFTLRPDLRWSDGKKIKASDYEYSLRRILDAASQSPHREKLMAIRGAEELSSGGIMLPGQLGVAATDDARLRVELKRTSSSLLGVFAQPWTGAVSREHVERYLNKWTLPERWVGGGAFVPAVSSPTTLLLRKNPYHRFAGLLKIDEVLVNLVKTRKEGMALYAKGQAHVFGQRDFDVPEEDRSRLAARRDLAAQPDFLSTILRLNTAKIPFSQEKLRQAISMAIDRDLILSGLGTAGERAALSLIPEGTADYDPPSAFLYSPQKARQMLASLGYCTADAQLGCTALPLIEIAHLASARQRKMALALTVLLKRNLGWKNVDIKELAREDFLGAIAAASYTVALDEIAVLPEHPFGFLDAFRKDRGTAGGFAHREYERVLDQAELAARWEEAKTHYRHAEGILLQDGGIIPLYSGATYILVNPVVGGFIPNIWDDHPWSQIVLGAPPIAPRP